MGYALAQAAIDRGAQVILVSGPVALDAPRGRKWCGYELRLKCVTPSLLIWRQPP